MPETDARALSRYLPINKISAVTLFGANCLLTKVITYQPWGVSTCLSKLSFGKEIRRWCVSAVSSAHNHNLIAFPSLLMSKRHYPPDLSTFPAEAVFFCNFN